MRQLLYEPWPWYIAGPIIGLMVPLLLLLANKTFGISSSLRHACAACYPSSISFFKYNWKKESWNLYFVLGILIGGGIGSFFTNSSEPVGITADTVSQLKALGVENFTALIPVEIFSWENLFSLQGFILMVLGGFMIGFGARWAGGCTSGHAIMGLSYLQWPSLVSVIGFFIGGLIMTHLLFPLIFNL